MGTFNFIGSTHVNLYDNNHRLTTETYHVLITNIWGNHYFHMLPVFVSVTRTERIFFKKKGRMAAVTKVPLHLDFSHVIKSAISSFFKNSLMQIPV